jgi:hypothetical protein
MSVVTILKCEYCPRTTPSDKRDGWGTLEVQGRVGIRAESHDICPGCIAKLRGWKPNPRIHTVIASISPDTKRGLAEERRASH